MPIKDRLMTDEDVPFLENNLFNDPHHPDTTSSFFQEPGTIAKVYEDEQGPICFARAASSLRLDIQFVDNADKNRNAKVLIDGFEPLAELARANGYKEIVFTTDNPALANFCERYFGYEVVPDKFVLRRFL